VLQPPLYDPKLDDAPNYGNTGSTIGHELTHAFDDEGRQFDGQGNLKDWWTPADAKAFEERVNCVREQFAGYTIVDEIKINSKLTSGKTSRTSAGTLLAYLAWKAVDPNETARSAASHPISVSSSASRSGRARTSGPRICARTRSRIRIRPAGTASTGSCPISRSFRRRSTVRRTRRWSEARHVRYGDAMR